jgi:hypothetical protein
MYKTCIRSLAPNSAERSLSGCPSESSSSRVKHHRIEPPHVCHQARARITTGPGLSDPDHDDPRRPSRPSESPAACSPTPRRDPGPLARLQQAAAPAAPLPTTRCACRVDLVRWEGLVRARVQDQGSRLEGPGGAPPAVRWAVRPRGAPRGCGRARGAHRRADRVVE